MCVYDRLQSLQFINMSEQIVTAEQLEKLHNAFDAFDEDCDGFIDAAMLVKALRAVGFNPTPEEVEDMQEDVDGKPLNFSTFLYIVYHHSRYVDVEQELVNAFRVFDKEKKGRLPVGTVRAILQNTRKPFTESQIDDILDHANVKNGFVDYADMVKVILSA